MYRYFPAPRLSTLGATEDVVVGFSLPAKELEDLDNLVAVGKFGNRNDAIKWLVAEGIKSKRDYLDRAAHVRAQIEQLKRKV